MGVGEGIRGMVGFRCCRGCLGYTVILYLSRVTRLSCVRAQTRVFAVIRKVLLNGPNFGPQALGPTMQAFSAKFLHSRGVTCVPA